MKHEWRKQENELYLPKQTPTTIEISTMSYYTLEGKGNPNGNNFKLAVGVLYAMSYGITMTPKKGINHEEYFDYTVYPLEGFWSFDTVGSPEHSKNQTIDKEHLIFKIMIRQPEFVTEDFAMSTLERISSTKPNPFNKEIIYEKIDEGLSLQLMHHGSYDSEPESFNIMNQYCIENNFERTTPTHKEIYITDAQKTKPKKNKIVLRYNVKHLNSNQ